jgi:hypothetical protein
MGYADDMDPTFKRIVANVGIDEAVRRTEKERFDAQTRGLRMGPSASQTVIRRVAPELNGRCYLAADGYFKDDDLVTSAGNIKVFDTYAEAGEMADDLAKHHPGAKWSIERA